MCGIVAVIAKTTLKAQLGIFEEMLYCDALRGWHSTGVFTKDGFHKKAVLPHWLINDREYKSLSDKYAKLGWNFMVGHNRAATVGKVSDQNAHPFKEGNITLVQNGTLKDHHLMPDHNKFDVDSQMACHAIDKLGIKDALPLMNGAYVFVWHDAKDNTLHMLKNSQRPFYLQKVGSVYYGASEKNMLLWVLDRNKQTVKPEEGFELENMVEYVFDDGELVSRIARKGYVAKTTYSYTNSTYTSKTAAAVGKTIPAKTANGKTTTVTTTNTNTNAAVNNVLKDKVPGILHGSTIDVVVERCSTAGAYFRAEGYEVNSTENVLIYGLTEKLEEQHVYRSKVIGAWLAQKEGENTKELTISVAARPDDKYIEHLGDFDAYYKTVYEEIQEDDKVAYRCDWCFADVYESEKVEAKRIAQAEGYSSSQLCLDCCDGLSKGTALYPSNC